MDVRQLKTDFRDGRLSAGQLFDAIDTLHQTVKRLQAEVDRLTQRLARYEPEVLHPELVTLLREWLATKKRLTPDTILFPMSCRGPGCTDCKTHKMIAQDLNAARQKWIEDARDSDECLERIRSDFLRYCNHDGLYADFHSTRHSFVTSLSRAGVNVKTAQVLARHSDVRLTLGVYTHVERADCTAAIGSLPATGLKIVSLPTTVVRRGYEGEPVDRKPPSSMGRRDRSVHTRSGESRQRAAQHSGQSRHAYATQLAVRNVSRAHQATHGR